MLYSMTGYGKADKVIDDVQYTVEIKTLNSKFFDAQVRIPSEFREKEMELRKLLEKELRRGKIQLFINKESLSGEPQRHINTTALRKYMEEISETFPESRQDMLLAHLLTAPEVWEKTEPEDMENLWSQLTEAIHGALEGVHAFRTQEGEEIEKDMRDKLMRIEKGLEEVKKQDPLRIQKIKERLDKALEEIKDRVDPVRYEQEVLFYMDRLDINEEKSRLANHIRYFRETLESPELLKGKKLQFIAQEMGREINTMGSKANDAVIQREVVEMKNALEKIKEQTANVL